MSRKRALVIAVAILALLAAASALLVTHQRRSGAGGLRSILADLASPHGLNPSHADAGCLTCHAPRPRTANAGCTAGDCHGRAELERSEAKPAAAELHRRVPERRCVECHTEHRGGPVTLGFHRSEFAAAFGQDCAGCHNKAAEAHPGIPTDRCAACHTSTARWTDVDFDHNTVWDWPCAACHR